MLKAISEETDMARICPQCEKHVPKFYVDENGKKHNCQRRKYCFECSPYGDHNTSKLETKRFEKGVVVKTCPDCKKEHYQNGNRCFACYFQKRQKEITKKVQAIVGTKCWICGYNKTWNNICFHHVNPDDKLFGLSTRELVGYRWDRVLKEMEKCILVCHNCHGEIHDNLINESEIVELWQKMWKIINLNKSSQMVQ
jgi:hypothetical protein